MHSNNFIIRISIIKIRDSKIVQNLGGGGEKKREKDRGRKKREKDRGRERKKKRER